MDSRHPRALKFGRVVGALALMSGAWGLAACSADTTPEDLAPLVDAVGVDAGDAAEADADAPPTVDAVSPDAGTTDVGAGSADAVADASAATGADGAGGPVDAEPLARIYENDPLDDDLVEVVMPHLTDPDGYLVGEFANVHNCVQEVDQTFEVQGVTVGVCKMTRKAQRGPDGTYLHVEPSDDRDGNDAFAELMMYWHVNRIHDYYRDVHGLTSLDKPLDAIVNVQVHVDQFGGWLPFDNAAFVPKESLDQLPFPLGVDDDALIFGQGTNVDFSYESAVIYHEYTHAIVGTTRLVGFVADEYGVDPFPGAMNEGFADYFAATVLDSPLIGAYALTNVPSGFGGGPPQDLSRDLSELHTCPDDLFGEVHADGRIIGSALWAMREAIGAEAADRIVLSALETFSDQTGLSEAAQALVGEAAALDPALEQPVRDVLEAHGLLDCARVLSSSTYQTQQEGGERYLLFAGTQETGLSEFGGGVPSFVQWELPAVPEGGALRLRVEVTPGGMMGLGPLFGNVPNPDLTFLFKRGSEPIRYAYDGGKPTSDADFSVHVDPVSSPGGALAYELVLGGACVAVDEPLTFQFVNRAELGGAVTFFEAGLVDPDAVDVTVTWDECSAEPAQ